MYKNKEGYPDPVQGQAINGVRREERQQALERKHGLKRGQKIVIETVEREERHGNRKYSKKKITYTIVELYQHCVLLVNQHGTRFCPSYTKLGEMIRGEQ